MHFPVFMEIDS